jgi:hypothetical protein
MHPPALARAFICQVASTTRAASSMAMAGTKLAHAQSKVHKSALCLIPPRSTWQKLQLIRCFKDKSFVRWPPHINLLYPFVEDVGDNFSQAAASIAQAVAGLEPFEVGRSLSESSHSVCAIVEQTTASRQDSCAVL